MNVLVTRYMDRRDHERLTMDLNFFLTIHDASDDMKEVIRKTVAADETFYGGASTITGEATFSVRRSD